MVKTVGTKVGTNETGVEEVSRSADASNQRQIDRCGPLGRVGFLAHNPKVGGSNPPPHHIFPFRQLILERAPTRGSGRRVGTAWD